MLLIGAKINDRERSLFQNACVFEAHHENLNESRLTLSARRCSPVTPVSGNIRFMRIFAGVTGQGASNDSGVIENVIFRAFGFGILGNEAYNII